MAFVPKSPIPTSPPAQRTVEDIQLDALRALETAAAAPMPELPPVQRPTLREALRIGGLAAAAPEIGDPILKSRLANQDPVLRAERQFGLDMEVRQGNIDSAIALGQRASAARNAETQARQVDLQRAGLELQIAEFQEGLRSQMNAELDAQARGMNRMNVILNGPTNDWMDAGDDMALAMITSGDERRMQLGKRIRAELAVMHDSQELADDMFVQPQGGAEGPGSPPPSAEDVDMLIGDEFFAARDRINELLDAHGEVLGDIAEQSAVPEFDIGDVPEAARKDFQQARSQRLQVIDATASLERFLASAEELNESGGGDRSTIGTFIKGLLSPGGRLADKDEAEFTSLIASTFAPIRTELIGARQDVEELRRVRPFLPDATDDPMRLRTALKVARKDADNDIFLATSQFPGLLETAPELRGLDFSGPSRLFLDDPVAPVRSPSDPLPPGVKRVK